MSKDAYERFVKIHEHYDFFNHLFSFGLDIGWRNEAAKDAIIEKQEYKVLDLSAGTGDLTIAIKKHAQKNNKDVKIIGTDFNDMMLEHAKEKVKNMGMKNVSFSVGDSLKTGYPAASFDVVTSGFALRSYDDLTLFAKELRRILKSGGKFVLLDMAKPDHGALLVGAYFRVMPVIGSVVDKKVYWWLTDSIWKFDKRGMARILQKQGFKDVKLRNLRSGIAYIITGTKP